jgi:hypothetical protein
VAREFKDGADPRYGAGGNRGAALPDPPLGSPVAFNNLRGDVTGAKGAGQSAQMLEPSLHPTDELSRLPEGIPERHIDPNGSRGHSDLISVGLATTPTGKRTVEWAVPPAGIGFLDTQHIPERSQL